MTRQAGGAVGAVILRCYRRHGRRGCRGCSWRGGLRPRSAPPVAVLLCRPRRRGGRRLRRRLRRPVWRRAGCRRRLWTASADTAGRRVSKTSGAVRGGGWRRGRRPALAVGAGAADGGEDGGVAVAVLVALPAFAAAGGTRRGCLLYTSDAA